MLDKIASILLQVFMITCIIFGIVGIISLIIIFILAITEAISLLT